MDKSEFDLGPKRHVDTIKDRKKLTKMRGGFMNEDLILKEKKSKTKNSIIPLPPLL